MTTMTMIRLTGDDLADTRALTFMALHEAAGEIRDGLVSAWGATAEYIEVLAYIGTDMDTSVWVYEDVDLSREQLDCLVRFALAERKFLHDSSYPSDMARSRDIAMERLALIDRFLTLAGGES